MGHSHSHDHSPEPTSTNILPTSKTVRGKLLQLITQRYRRVSTSILFSAFAILLPPILLRRRSITKTDTAIFCFFASALAGADNIRKQMRQMRKRALRIRDGFVKSTFILQNTTKLEFNVKNNEADRVTFIGVFVNLFLSVGKASVGVTCHSSALIADAAHSLSDLFSDFITLWAVQISRLPPDDDHPYGHGKFEAVGSLFLALMLLGTGLHVGATSNAKLFRILSIRNTALGGLPAAVKIPTVGALIMAGFSITSKEWLYRITKKVGEDLNSQVLIANAWHHRSDAYSSILALASIGLAMSVPGMLAADSAAGLLVAGMICMTGMEIMGEAVKQLTDTGDRELVARVRKHLLSEVEESDDILEITRVRARWMGSKAIVDMAVKTKDSLSSSAIRAVEERLRFRIMEKEDRVLDADVHATGGEGLETGKYNSGGTNGNQLEWRSPCQVESITRELLLRHNQVKSVEGCTVHYKDMRLANIDVNIKLKAPELTTITSATLLATELKELLEKSDRIDQASIFLDVNENDAVIKDTVVTDAIMNDTFAKEVLFKDVVVEEA